MFDLCYVCSLTFARKLKMNLGFKLYMEVAHTYRFVQNVSNEYSLLLNNANRYLYRVEHAQVAFTVKNYFRPRRRVAVRELHFIPA